MTSSLESDMGYLPEIERIMPDLHVHKIQSNTDGLANEVVFVNDEFVFRFPKGEFGHLSLARELQALSFLHGKVNLQIPEPLYASESAVVYRFIKGEPFLRESLAALRPEERAAAAEHLAAFLKAMHSIEDVSLPYTSAPVDSAAFQKQRQAARQKVYPHLLPHQVAWAEQVYAFIDQPDAFTYKPVLVHGDLAPYHILFDPQSHQVRGVIDFGVSGLGDPASDLGSLLGYYAPANWVWT